MKPERIEELAWVVQGADVNERPAVRAAANYAIRTAVREALDAAADECAFMSPVECIEAIRRLRDSLTGEPPKT